MPYARRPSKVEVYHYQRQPRAEWPQWLQDYDGYNDVSGKVAVAIDPVGILLIPQGNAFDRALPGDFVVYEETGERRSVRAYTQREFDAFFAEEDA